ncbi:carbohydrate kinase family protein [Oerskovia flava]|uniref:carbohydrate kinase family protein n=1 Tax=Oerskovia flava TaxID=2986422 RepID=UPI00223F17E8|nr:carbohydrate kinase [Oerskovia sp. JB1-3-2]
MTAPTLPEHVLVVGEALIDVVHRADGSVDEHPGGSPANVALTLGRLGRDARVLTWVGADAHGELVGRWLRSSGVRLVAGSEDAPATSLATAHLDASGAATYTFDLTWQVPAGARAEQGALAVHTGSIAAVLEPGGTGVLELVRAAREHATVTYDPNARPQIMGDPAQVRARIEDFVAASDVVKVSDEDVEWLVPGHDPVDVARQWLALGPAVVVVTFGGEGAVAVTAAGETRVAAPRIDVVDTVGAGDSFMGALLDGLWTAGLLGAERREELGSIDEPTLRTVLEQCVAVAAVTVSRAGANPPTRAELTAG